MAEFWLNDERSDRRVFLALIAASIDSFSRPSKLCSKAFFSSPGLFDCVQFSHVIKRFLFDARLVSGHEATEYCSNRLCFDLMNP